jgi:hypothetical protein
VNESIWIWFFHAIAANYPNPPAPRDIPPARRKDDIFGLDWQTFPDIELTPVPGLICLASDIAKRHLVPRGGIHYAPSAETFDARSFVNDQDTAKSRFELVSRSVRVATADPRVRSATAAVRSWGEGRIRLLSELQTEAGPFSFVLDISEVTVNVLRDAP